MKKYVSLLSLLVLTACATGGNGPDERFRVASSSKFLYATEQAADSNKVITPMNSEVVVCNGTCPAHLDRITGTPSHARVSLTQQGATELAVYDLSDVTFTMADEKFVPGEESFTFVIDNTDANGSRGKIIGIDRGFGKEDSFPEGEEAVLVRRREYATFDGYVNDKASEEAEDNWKKATYTYKSWGSDKLRFSDFGTLTINETGENGKTWNPVFIGGYDAAKKIDPKTVASQTVEFSGTAAGFVSAISAGEDSGTSIGLKDTDAKLVLTVDGNTATSELNAKFNNWYDVAYTETGDTKTIVLSNYQGMEDYKMLTPADGDGNVTIGDARVNSDIRYFGDNEKPSEAVGIIQVRDCNGGVCAGATDPTPEVRMNLGFGVTK